MDAAALAGAHLLLLDDEIEPSDVVTLLTTRQPGATLGEDGTWRLSRHSSLVGPVSLTDEDAAALGIPPEPGVPSVFVLEAPVEREDGPPPEWYRDRNGLHLAYPEGLPHREEGRFLELLIDIARRLHLSVRLSDAPGTADPAAPARFVNPDPDDAVNLQVFSGYWLTPETLLPVVQRVAPGAELAIDGAEWQGPPPGLVDSPEEGDADAELTMPERVALHARADQFDAEALGNEQVLDGYGIVIDLTRDPEAVAPEVDGVLEAGGNAPTGVIELRMHVADEIPPALVNTDWGAFDVVEYEIRWMDDAEERYQREPSDEYIAARAAARPVVEALARVVVEAVSGEILDEFGFLVDRYQL